MVDATLRELEAIGVSSPETVLADPGYWHKQQMENVVSRGIQVLIPPDSGLRTEPRPGWDKGLYAFMRLVLVNRSRPDALQDGWPPSSPCSGRSSTTAGSTASNDEADPPCARSGD